MATVGYAFGFINRETDLAVYESTSLYPEFTLPELANVADVIVRAEVAEAGDTFMKEIPVSLTENPDKATESLSYPVIPIILTVYSSVKGAAPQKLIYYEEGGVAENYIQQPDGYAMESGMEVFLFLNEVCDPAENPLYESKGIGIADFVCPAWRANTKDTV